MTTQSLLDRAAEFDKATPGEWCDDGDMIGTRADIVANIICEQPPDKCKASLAFWPANKRAIIEARSLVPELAAELKRVTEWRDISTAPKDGTAIMLFCPNRADPVIGFWNGTDWEDRTGFSRWTRATHYRELPKGPTT